MNKTLPKYKQSRNWCFTDFKLLNFNEIYNEYNDVIRYICWGEELCPKTSKKHFQGWIQFFNKKTMGGVKKILKSKEIHLENCRGSEFDNDKYCKKDNKYTHLGKFICQGSRTDLEAIKKVINKGVSKKFILDNYFETYCKYRNGINDYQKESNKHNRRKFRKVEVEYVYGKTGTGKTRYGMKNSQFKITADNLKWWDGYDGEKSILIDEYDNQVNITKLLNILDGYQLRLPIKGGFTYANWDKVIITSNLEKDQLHPQAKKAHREALFRRISKFTHLLSKEEKIAKVLQKGNTNNLLDVKKILNSMEYDTDEAL